MDRGNPSLDCWGGSHPSVPEIFVRSTEHRKVKRKSNCGGQAARFCRTTSTKFLPHSIKKVRLRCDFCAFHFVFFLVQITNAARPAQSDVLNHKAIGHRWVRRLHVYTRTSWSRAGVAKVVDIDPLGSVRPYPKGSTKA
ncbi:hypothetical protein T4A_7181 [Trichinella pseudospiralis]|uniref:Uncharacterized protein n=1 Tax=Trichinella pseudospiralis TaxID=6337 RepID=A0A0V1F0G6_TRIPS|nr:hypothetical protein T4A_7181 [Trichinella pseudospiralis]